MEFQNSQTFINLARSFAGESQAGMRYQLIGKTGDRRRLCRFGG